MSDQSDKSEHNSELQSEERSNSSGGSQAPSTTTTSSQQQSSSAEYVSPRETKYPQQAIRLLSEVHPTIIRTSSNLLQFYLRRENKISNQNDSLTHFCLQQCAFTAINTNERLIKHVITYKDIRDNVENLVVLHKRVLKTAPEAAQSFGVSIQKLTTVLGDIASILECMCEVAVTDWEVVGKTIIARTRSVSPFRRIDLTHYVVPMDDLKELGKLGAGGFGIVYRVLYKPANAIFAMKIVSKNRFLKAKNACVDKCVASLTRSPLIVAYYCCYATQNAQITLMEYIQGVDLLGVLKKPKFLPYTEARLIIAQLLLSIEYLHLKGFIHRDIKPSNAMIKPTGHIKLTDYDTVKICVGHYLRRVYKTFFRLTAGEFRENESAGSIPYMAPETLKKSSYGRACDWWSLGVTCYKLTTGRVPFRGKNKNDFREKIINRPLKWPKANTPAESVAPLMKEFTFNLLKKKPQKRLGSKIYSDLKRCDIFNNLEFSRLINTNVVFNCAAAETNSKCSTPFSRTKTTTKQESESSGKKRKTQRVLFEEVEDATPESHVPLFTFASYRFKKVVDRLKSQKEPYFKSENALTKRSTPSPEMDYSKMLDPLTTLESGMISNDVQSKKLDAQETFQIERQKTFGIFRSFVLPLKEVYGEGKSIYHMVDTMSPTLSAIQSGLVYGDIIASVNGNKVVGIPLAGVENLIKSVQEPRLNLSVYSTNPFRLVATQKDLTNFINQSPQVEFTVASVESRRCFTQRLPLLITHEGKTWNDVHKTFQTIHLVLRTNSNMRILAPKSENIFMGDILIQINGIDTETMSKGAINQVLLIAVGEITLKIVAVSVLRRKEYHESIISYVTETTPKTADIN